MEVAPVLEILVLVLVSIHIYKIAKRKNRSPVGYVLLLIGSYFLAACAGGIGGLVVSGARMEDDKEFILAFLPGYLIGAALAVGFSYLVVGMVPPLEKRRDYDDYDDDDDRPRRRPRYREDYEDEGPRSRRHHDDDDDHDRPRRRREDNYD
jgi:hypothetical protein